jgi:hypothetical protein
VDEDPLDLQSLLDGVSQARRDVALGIDDDGSYGSSRHRSGS